MAFDITRFGSDSSNVKSILDGVRYYRYFNKDNNTLTTPGYFPADLGLNVGDRIAVVPSTKTNADETYIVSSVADRVVTVTKVNAGGGAVESVNGQTGAVVLDAEDVGAQETLVSGTNIKTINGESVLGDGNLTINAGGIDWETTVDLPADFMPSDWGIYPVFRIADGLPDGEYEMYFQAKKSNGTSAVFGLATYVFRFSIDNANRQYAGWFEPIIDGNWGGINDRILSDGNYLYSAFWTDNGDLVIYNNGEAFTTSIHGYFPNTAVPECFKLSAIKNIATGDEYVATGTLYNNESFQTSWSGQLRCEPLQQSPTIPSYYERFSTGVSDGNALNITGIQYYNGRFQGVSEIAISLSLGDDVFNATFKVLADGYELIVEDATGVFETTQIGRMTNFTDSIYVKFNFPVGTTGTINSSIGWKGGSKDVGHYVGSTNVDNTFEALNVLKVGVTPASANYLGKIMQYTGTTDANYTNGHFYKATGTVVTVPQSLTTTSVNPNDCSVTIDVDNLIPALQTQTGWTQDDIIRNLNSNYQWQVYYDWDNATITSVYWGVYGLFSDASILSCFTVSTTGSYSGESTISFFATYTPESQTISGGAWEHINVDSVVALLESVTGYDATKNQTLKNTAGVISWVDDAI